MTRVSAFLFFFTSTQSSQSRTPHSYTLIHTHHTHDYTHHKHGRRDADKT